MNSGSTQVGPRVGDDMDPLVKLVAIVWSAATLIALFVGLPALLTVAGVEINAGLIVNALAAAGAFSAAGTAAWIATSDRRERKKERDAEDEVQSKLVILQPACRDWDSQTAEMQRIEIPVTNHGTRAIVDVTFVRLTVEGHVFDDLRPTSESRFPVVAPGGRVIFKLAPPSQPETPLSQALRGGRGVPRSIDGNTKMTAWVRWTDVNGKTWERRGSGPLLQLEQPVRIDP